MQGANNVYCYWQQGVQTSEIQNSKSIRSRFVEELIWEKEKEQNAIIAVQEMDISHLGNMQNSPPCIRILMSNPLAPLRRQKKGVILTDKAMELCLKDNFPKKISATALDTYLHCPAKFYYSYLAKIKVKYSFSRKGCPCDYACIESFHALLKKKEVHHQTYIDSKDAYDSIFEYIELGITEKDS